MSPKRHVINVHMLVLQTKRKFVSYGSEAVHVASENGNG